MRWLSLYLMLRRNQVTNKTILAKIMRSRNSGLASVNPAYTGTPSERGTKLFIEAEHGLGVVMIPKSQTFVSFEQYLVVRQFIA